MAEMKAAAASREIVKNIDIKNKLRCSSLYKRLLISQLCKSKNCFQEIKQWFREQLCAAKTASTLPCTVSFNVCELFCEVIRVSVNVDTVTFTSWRNKK